jgi:hypothetical protein
MRNTSSLFLSYEVSPTYIYMFKSKGAIEMHERGVIISKCRVSHPFHCVTPSSCTMVSQKLPLPGDEQHLYNQKCIYLIKFSLVTFKLTLAPSSEIVTSK